MAHDNPLKDADKFTRRALADFPESFVPEGEWRVIFEKENRPFGIGGIDEDHRLVVFGDDGWIIGYDLDDASVESTPHSPRLDAEYETLADMTMPEEFMFDRDVSEWVWVNPRYEWLIAGGGE